MSYRNFETKKSVHINLTLETHTEFKITAFKRGLSMQEIFEEMARRIIEGDDHMLRVLHELEQNKRNKVMRQLSKTDAESIFRVIEEENPLDD